MKKKFLAKILVLVLFFQVIPVWAFAYNENSLLGEPMLENALGESGAFEPFVIGELTHTARVFVCAIAEKLGVAIRRGDDTVSNLRYEKICSQPTQPYANFFGIFNWKQYEMPVTVIATNEQEQKNEPFVLTISTNKTDLAQGENTRIYVELKNNSGEDYEIATFFLFYPRIPNEGWFFTRIPPPYPRFRIFDGGSSILQTFYLNSYYRLSEGTYQLTVEAVFYLGWEQPANPENEPWPWAAPDNAQRVNIVSNIVEITVR